MNKLAIFGTSGFSKEVLDIALDQDYKEIVFLTHDENVTGDVLGFPVQHESNISKLAQNGFVFVIAAGSGEIREKIYKKYPDLTYPNLIHSSVTWGYQMAETFACAKGLIFAAGVRVTTACEVGNFIVLNLNTTIGHDSRLDDFVSVMPGVNISGNVHLGFGSYVGTGATILQGKDEDNKMIIGSKSVVGAGSVVVKPVAENIVVVGAPAKELKRA
ncbi:sugar O-acyltransferase [Acinetobacter sp. RIT698]|jgi:sugar O-acyltransferase (sialic acid O-acetyltransferase NeuD family)|uniref:PglD-related sugar-binding protein n=1 Tax=Acinetobacter TaxID=469 RepID=UPI0012AC7D8C|nr:sugar O-acyltransferase [Acinetobacter sp. RIT698]MRT37993.1 sugar O-acyltransferase [Acinetobacter sp. RIT698]